METKEFAKVHKKKTGYSLRSEQISGEYKPLTDEERQQLLAECRAFDAQYGN